MKRAGPSGCRKTGAPPEICGHCRYPELYRLAEEIAREVFREINERVPGVKSEMRYKTGFVLEKCIEILQQAV
jgi:hypothetical protein